MLNYEVDPEILRSRIPAGTELDFWNGKTYLSVVGFQFFQTRLLGWKIPFHVNFSEVNLRFYVRHKSGQEWRRGVVFIREIVPRWAIAQVARRIYNEPYVAIPMRSDVYPPTESNGWNGSITYEWKWRRNWGQVSAQPHGTSTPLPPGSNAEFIAEHYWGYTRQRDGSTIEYRVDHPAWRVWQADECRFSGDIHQLYGPEFVSILAAPPSTAFVADGSTITVQRGLPMRI